MSNEHLIIYPNYAPGTHVDYVFKGIRGGCGPGGDFGAPISAEGKTIAVQQPVQPFAGIPGTTGPAPGGGFSLAIPGTQASSAFQKAVEEGTGARRRAVIDEKVSDTEYRLLLRTGELVWADYREIEPLDAISKLGDLVGPASRGIGDLLADDHLVPECADCDVKLPNEEDQRTLNGVGRIRCAPCFDKKLGLT